MSEAQTKKKGSSKIRKFFAGVKTEFQKIIWPDRDTILKQLAAVLIVTVITGVLIALIDFGAEDLINLLVSIGQ